MAYAIQGLKLRFTITLASEPWFSSNTLRISPGEDAERRSDWGYG